MRLVWLSLISSISLALGKQIPVVDGVIGGVPTFKDDVKPESANTSAVTPGKLRFVENSGVCGMSPSKVNTDYSPLTYKSERNDSWCGSGIWVWRHSFRQESVLLVFRVSK
jgi:hypothetical protein